MILIQVIEVMQAGGCDGCGVHEFLEAELEGCARSLTILALPSRPIVHNFAHFLFFGATELNRANMSATTTATAPAPVAGPRKNGKQWHEPKKAFRLTAGQTSYAKRVAREAQVAEMKKVENEMKGEKEQERQVRACLFLYCLRCLAEN